MRIYYQNLNCRSGYSPTGGDTLFPGKICLGQIKKHEADAFVFVEAYEKLKGYEEFCKEAETLRFRIITSTFKEKQNQVMIGIPADLEVSSVTELGEKIETKGFRVRGINSVLPEEVVAPNYLCVKTKEATIVGARIPVYSFYNASGMKQLKKDFNARAASFEMLTMALNQDTNGDSRVVVVMDANNARLSGDFYEEFEPRKYKDYSGKELAQFNHNFHRVKAAMRNLRFELKEGENDYSFVYQNLEKEAENPGKQFRTYIHDDHCFFRGLPDLTAEFIWDFVSEENGYGKRTNEENLSGLTGLPDHAGILVTF